MQFVLKGLAIFLFYILKAKCVDQKSRLMETANFDVLLREKKNGKPKSFFSFPEVKTLFAGQPPSADEIPVIASVIHEKPRKLKHKTLKKIVKQNQKNKRIELAPDIEDLLPNSDKLLMGLKPTKPKVLKFKTNVKLRQSKLKNVETNIENAKPKAFKAFDRFNKDIKDKSLLSNRKLVRNFRQNVRNSRHKAEMNFQSFVGYAVEAYMNQTMRMTQMAHQGYHMQLDRNKQDLMASIRLGVRAESIRINKELMANFTRIAETRFEKFKKDLINIQKFYNNNYIDDQKEINKIMGTDRPIPQSPGAFDIKDDLFFKDYAKAEMQKL